MKEKKILIVLDKSKISHVIFKVLISLVLSFITLSIYYYPINHKPIHINYYSEQLIKDEIIIDSRLFKDNYYITLNGIYFRKNYEDQIYVWNSKQRDVLNKEKLVDNFELLNIATQDSLQQIEYSNTEVNVDPVFQAIVDSLSALPKTDDELAKIEKEKQNRETINSFQENYIEEIKSLFDQYNTQLNYSSIKNQGTYIDLDEQVSDYEVFIVFILPMIISKKYLLFIALASVYLGLLYLAHYLKANISIKFK